MTAAHKIASDGSVPDDTTGPAPVSDALHIASLPVAGVLRPRPASSSDTDGQGMAVTGASPTKTNAADRPGPAALTPTGSDSTREV